MQDPEFPEIVALICKEDGRFDRKALRFRAARARPHGEGVAQAGRRPRRDPRHVSGTELLDGLRVYALDQFGPLAKTVLNAWGVRECRDFGEIVFNLIDYNVFSKTESDRREDSTELYDSRTPLSGLSFPPGAARGTSAAEAVGSGLSRCPSQSYPRRGPRPAGRLLARTVDRRSSRTG